MMDCVINVSFCHNGLLMKHLSGNVKEKKIRRSRNNAKCLVLVSNQRSGNTMLDQKKKGIKTIANSRHQKLQSTAISASKPINHKAKKIQCERFDF
jgi:hypothetical protein